jgi:hypothetical protein
MSVCERAMDITKVAGQTHPSSSYQPARPAALPTASAAASEAAARAAASSAPGSHRRLGLDSERARDEIIGRQHTRSDSGSQSEKHHSQSLRTQPLFVPKI